MSPTFFCFDYKLLTFTFLFFFPLCFGSVVVLIILKLVSIHSFLFTFDSLGFLCPLTANVYNIDFLSFEIKDYDTKRVIFEVNKDAAASALPADFDFSMLDESVYRKIKYDFSVDVLRLPNIQTV